MERGREGGVGGWSGKSFQMLVFERCKGSLIVEFGFSPVCREPCEESQLLRVVKHKKSGVVDGEGSQGGKTEVSLRSINFKASTKLRALVDGLKKTRDEFPGVKTVVFR